MPSKYHTPLEISQVCTLLKPEPLEKSKPHRTKPSSKSNEKQAGRSSFRSPSERDSDHSVTGARALLSFSQHTAKTRGIREKNLDRRAGAPKSLTRYESRARASINRYILGVRI